MTETAKRKLITKTSNSAILVGNDINNVVPGYSWSDLLGELIAFVGATGVIPTTSDQFPLLYEEIWAYAGKNGMRSEAEIKTFIAEKTKKIAHNGIHAKLMDIGFSDVLTTNYDYGLERSESTGFSPKNFGKTQESRYSLFRYSQLNRSRVWHIHGEAEVPGSIALGYEHYSGYLQNMRNYVVSGTGTAYRTKYDALLKRLKSGNLKYESWLDVLFTKNVHILGLRLDFVEIHLWWLLTFIARMKNEKKYPLTNALTYYLPSYHDDPNSQKQRLLRSLGVNVVVVDAVRGEKESYYTTVLNNIPIS